MRQFLLWAAATVLLCVTTCAQAPRSEQPKPQAPPRQARTLQVTSTKVLTTPAFGYWGPPLCDDTGNLYLQPAGSEDASVFKLSQTNESDSRMFAIPADATGSDALLDYAVTPSGSLYMLAQDAKQHFHVFSFNSDGAVKHDSKLEIPEYVALVNLSVFDNDTMLATGNYQREAPENLRGKAYAGLFDPSGQPLKDLASRLSLDASSSDPASPVNRTSIRPGRDGNLYLLKQSSVLVVSPGGEVVHRIRFTKPDPSAMPLSLNVADGPIAIEFGDKPEAGKLVNPKYLVLNSATGKEYGYFSPPAELNRMLGCFTRSEGFLFVTAEKGSLKLVSARMN